MCLCIDEETIALTKTVIDLHTNSNTIVKRYKILECINNKWYSPYVKCRVLPTLISNRDTQALQTSEMLSGMVTRGIHVFTCKKSANNALKYLQNTWYNNNYRVFEVLCNINDLVAIGKKNDAYTPPTNEEVYMKIKIPALKPKLKEKTGEKTMIKWNDILGKNGKGQYRNVVEQFAREEVSRDEFLTNMSGVPGIRNLVRDHGVAEARRIARKALRRRNVTI